MENYVIPRNIKVKETIGFGLNGKQIIYLAVGIAGAGGVIATGLPILLKIGGIAYCIMGSLALSLAKAHGQELDRYVFESIRYPLRAKEFEGGLQYASNEESKKPPVVRLRYNL